MEEPVNRKLGRGALSILGALAVERFVPVESDLLRYVIAAVVSIVVYYADCWYPLIIRRFSLPLTSYTRRVYFSLSLLIMIALGVGILLLDGDKLRHGTADHPVPSQSQSEPQILSDAPASVLEQSEQEGDQALLNDKRNTATTPPPEPDRVSTQQQPTTTPEVRISQRPAVSMSFSYSNARLTWRMENPSESLVVQGILYWFALFNMSQAPPDRTIQPLQIPSASVSFVNPRDFSGGRVFPDNIEARLDNGDLVFGTAEIVCPGCTDRGYWLCYVHGKGGWYSEMRGHTSRGLELPMGAILRDPEKELEVLVPSERRIAF